MIQTYSATQKLAELLKASKLTLATAESCTGGGIGARLTDLAGSSAWFNGGIISYTNQVKQQLLGVDGACLEEHGAVSEQVVQQMAQGACRQLDADLAVAVSGVAGPDGGSEEKPVGTVWIAWAWGGGKNATTARCFHFSGDRSAVREATVKAAVDGLLHQLTLAAESVENPVN